MATWFQGPGGNDGSAGTSWAARWLTIAKTVAAANGVANGDTVYWGPGVNRETISFGTSFSANVNYIADVTGANTDGIGGSVQITGYTTSDVAAASATTTINFNGKSFITIQDLDVIAGSTGATFTLTTAGSHDITLRRCYAFSQGATAFTMTTTVDVAANLTVDSCILVGLSAMTFTFTRPTIADLNNNIVLKNLHTTSLTSNGFSFTATGAGLFNGGGVNILGCTVEISGNSTAFLTSSANLSTTFPINVYNCNLVAKAGTGFNANTAGQVIEDYCQLWVNSARTNVTAGTHSNQGGASWYPGLDFGQAALHGFARMPFNGPADKNSNLLNVGFQTGNPTADITGAPRSQFATGAGAATMACGAYELFNAGQYSTALHDAGSASVLVPGFGYQDLLLAVDNTQTTVSVKVQTASYGGTTYPQLQVIGPDGTVLGTANATIASSSGWESISVTFTLAAALSQVIVRLISQSNTTAGSSSFDTTGVV